MHEVGGSPLTRSARRLAQRASGAARSTELLWAAAVGAVAMILAVVLLQMWAWDLHVPQGTTGDFTLAGMIVKGLGENGGYLHNPSLGWPLGLQFFDLPIGDDNLNLFLMWIIGWFTSSFAVVMNVFMLLTFPMVAVAAYVVMRRLGASRWPAAMVGLLYTFLPYHF